MKREIIIIITIILTIVISDIIVQSHLENTSNVMTSKLEDLKEQITNSKENLKNEEIKESLEKVEREWEKVNKTWSIIVMHEELDNIEQALVKTKSSINEGEAEDRIRRTRNCIVLYKTCKRKRKNFIKKYFLNNETK